MNHKVTAKQVVEFRKDDDRIIWTDVNGDLSEHVYVPERTCHVRTRYLESIEINPEKYGDREEHLCVQRQEYLDCCKRILWPGQQPNYCDNCGAKVVE